MGFDAFGYRLRSDVSEFPEMEWWAVVNHILCWVGLGMSIIIVLAGTAGFFYAATHLDAG